MTQENIPKNKRLIINIYQMKIFQSVYKEMLFNSKNLICVIEYGRKKQPTLHSTKGIVNNISDEMQMKSYESSVRKFANQQAETYEDYKDKFCYY
ncbi:hypothetical protein T07_14789 [Trichinella nelsoni]|uniref:Uncharacterized protein n=1 Tax=Trichinella nelsoni TaxID=6336 RepID=A0A0V0RK64_9BILA|nr:hypothetical protein T07_14789 [Trichinella nelsoni]